MDNLWSPWRYQYVSAAHPASAGCIFCDKSIDDLVVFRGSHNFVLLNLFPYTSGHLMVVPYRHIATLEETDAETLTELMQLTRQAEIHLRTIYKPAGLNIGMNIGAAAGAGVAGHIHMHVLPRWQGDVNFMTTIAETRVLPEDLKTTHEKLSQAFNSE
jgi:ATP adenylyltransferase